MDPDVIIMCISVSFMQLSVNIGIFISAKQEVMFFVCCILSTCLCRQLWINFYEILGGVVFETRND